MLSRVLVALLSLSLAACMSLRTKHRGGEEAKTETVTQDAAPTPEEHLAATLAKTDVAKVAEATAPITTTATVPAVVETPVTYHQAPEGIAHEKALGWLKNGNTRFVKGWFRKDGKSPKDRARLATEQKPHTVILTSSDSRMPPEHIFDQALGEIFTVRVATDQFDSSVVASVEYAAQKLGTRLIVVMGRVLDRAVADIGPAPELSKESFDNAKGVAADLIARSEVLRTLVATGQVRVTSAIYDLRTGKVEFAE